MSATPAQRGVLVRAAAAAVTALVAAFALLSFGGSRRSVALVLVAVALLGGAAIGLQLTLGRARNQGVLRRARIVLPLATVLAGIALIVYWASATGRGNPTGGWGVAGVCALYLGVGYLLAEWRSRAGGAIKRGVIVLAASAALFLAGLVLCLTVAGWWLGVSVVALLAAPAGLTLLSEDVLRAPAPWIARGAMVGAAMVMAGALLLLVGGTTFWFAVALVLLILALVFAIASDTQADVLLIVTVLALCWALAPRGVALDDTVELAPGRPTLVAVGDSYMSGEGAQTFFQATNDPGSNECRRSPTAYAHLVVQPDSGASLRHVAFIACSGARAEHVYAHAQYSGEPTGDRPHRGATQREQLEYLVKRSRADVKLIVVSIGGNDAGFADIGMACLAPGRCVERGQIWLDRLDHVRAEVAKAYRAIREAAGASIPVLVVPYPQPIRERTCGSSLLANDEHRFLAGYVGQLDGEIRQAARDAHFYYLDDMVPALADRGLRVCDGPPDKAGVNFIAFRSVEGVVDQAAFPGNWIHNSLHPNERGHRAMAHVLADWLRSHPDPPPEPRGADVPAPFTRASLTDLTGRGAGTYCGGPKKRAAYCDRADADWAVTEVGVAVRGAAIPLLLVVGGWWLVALRVLEATRPRFRARGDAIALRAFGDQ